MAYLVHMAGLFGINENRARVALSRMVAAGEAVMTGSGRYRLAGHLLARQERQSASRAGVTSSASWDGDWHVVVLTAGARSAADRLARRKALVRARLGELRDGAWVRPANLDLSLPSDLRDEAVAFVGRLPGVASTEFTTTRRSGEDDAALAARLFDLETWAAEASHLLDALDECVVEAAEELAEGFVLSAAVLRHLQADPLLPAELLPADWPGPALRRRYDAWDARYREVLAEWSLEGPG